MSNDRKNAFSVPLAEQLRPTEWEEVIGQNHLTAPGKPLYLAFSSGKPHSMIFWGPPGVGKTTFARLCAKAFDAEWIALSAILAGVKDIRDAVAQARHHMINGRATILFIDEIHRFNKAQQDALLPFTESGLFTLIGATTENPSFEVNAALLSRAQVYVLKPLTDDALRELIMRAQQRVFPDLQFEEEVLSIMIQFADGDGRRVLNLVEQVAIAASLQDVTTISLALTQDIIASFNRRFDKKGDYFYNHISALHKSVRGSHPDAALYWLTCMLDGGVDPRYLARRIIRMAWEDIGLADLRALHITNEAAATYERLGSPEGELALAQAVIYLAIAPKSNAGYMAYKQALDFVKKDISREVPLHLCNAPTALMDTLGYGRHYRYAHDEPYAYAAGETYLPEGMREPHWYQPVNRGLEAKIAERMTFLRQLDEEYKVK